MPHADTLEIKRCAIYTRKSTNPISAEKVNSLEWQREICTSYITSQQHRGWITLPKRYDDAGYSGTDVNRPALSELMCDIEAGLVDVVVIYKVDRLTRSLLDFVRLLEAFDNRGVPFVSISQSFDTSDSLGRMILNILLTFSQFERELIAERIRDSIRMRKKHGKWHGGPPPLGYKLVRCRLKVCEEEAVIVRWLFAKFIELGTYRAVKEAAKEAGLRSVTKYTKTGRKRGDRLISAGNTYRILNNAIYVGDVMAEDGAYVGQHEPLISRETWNAAQALSASRRKAEPHCKQTDHFLAGLLWDSLGRRMMLYVERDRGRAYYYYVSSNAYWSQRECRRQFRSHATRLDKLILSIVANFLDDREKLRATLMKLGVLGPDLEKLAAKGKRAAEALQRLSPDELKTLLPAIIERIELSREHVTITFRSFELRRFLCWDQKTRFYPRRSEWTWTDARYVLESPVSAISAQRSPVIEISVRNPAAEAKPDARLVTLVQRARRALRAVEEHRDRPLKELAHSFDCRPSHFSRLIRLNYLAPDIVASILDGTQPPSLTAREVLEADLPLDWAVQRRLFGFPDLGREIDTRRSGGFE